MSYHKYRDKAADHARLSEADIDSATGVSEEIAMVYLARAQVHATLAQFWLTSAIQEPLS